MIRSILRLEPSQGRYEDLVRHFESFDLLGRAVKDAGSRRADLQLPVASRGPAVVTALWDDAAAYERWLGHEVRQRSAPELALLLESEPTRELYRIVLSVSGTDASR